MLKYLNISNMAGKDSIRVRHHFRVEKYVFLCIFRFGDFIIAKYVKEL